MQLTRVRRGRAAVGFPWCHRGLLYVSLFPGIRAVAYAQELLKNSLLR